MEKRQSFESTGYGQGLAHELGLRQLTELERKKTLLVPPRLFQPVTDALAASQRDFLEYWALFQAGNGFRITESGRSAAFDAQAMGFKSEIPDYPEEHVVFHTHPTLENPHQIRTWGTTIQEKILWMTRYNADTSTFSMGDYKQMETYTTPQSFFLSTPEGHRWIIPIKPRPFLSRITARASSFETQYTNLHRTLVQHLQAENQWSRPIQTHKQHIHALIAAYCRSNGSLYYINSDPTSPILERQ